MFKMFKMMIMRVNFYATLRQIVGKKTVDFNLEEDSSIQKLLDEIVRIYPDLRPELLDEHGKLYDHVHVIVNGRDTRFIDDGTEMSLTPEDTISIFPAVGGG